ncbi:MAG: hypothetical protein AAF901_14910 [Bacteroidota bacterium]
MKSTHPLKGIENAIRDANNIQSAVPIKIPPSKSVRKTNSTVLNRKAKIAILLVIKRTFDKATKTPCFSTGTHLAIA